MLFAQSRERAGSVCAPVPRDDLLGAVRARPKRGDPEHHREQRRVAGGERAVVRHVERSLALGSAIGGLLAAAFGRNTVFVINALSFVVSALLIRGMRFASRISRTLPPFQRARSGRFLADRRRYPLCSARPRLLATMFVKSGHGDSRRELDHAADLRRAHVSVRSQDGPAVRRHARHEPADVLARRRRVDRAVAGRAVVGPQRTRMRSGISLAFASGAARIHDCVMGAYVVDRCASPLRLPIPAARLPGCFRRRCLQKYTDDKFRGRVFSADSRS